MPGSVGRLILDAMDQYRCQACRQPIDATVTIPGSKSITNRALIAAALADGVSLLKGILLADDTRLMIDALKAMGIRITVDEAERTAEVTGCGGFLPATGASVFCGNSGTTIRFCTALAALGRGSFELDGVPRMHQRPIDGLTDALQVLGTGVEFPGQEGYPPLIIHGQGLRGGQVEFAAPRSSQWISALMLVAPYAQRELFVTVTGETPSLPYLKMTVAVMETFGVGVMAQYQDNNTKFIVDAPQRYQARGFEVEPDASNASYFLAAPAVAGGQVTVDGLGTASIQGDVRFVDVLERMGCAIERQPHRLTVRRPAELSTLRAIDIDLNDMPDMVPTLAVLALFADGPTTISNVDNLRIKETDRLSALANELRKLGADIDEKPDGLCIHPPETPTGATLQTYDDHRMAMSFALAGLRHDAIAIENPSCCAKTFPDFFERFARMASTATE